MSKLGRAVYGHLRSTISAHGRHAGAQFAAAIAYRVLFSLVPFLALVVAILDLVLPASAREEFVDWLFASIPGTGVESSVDRALVDSGATAPVVAVLALGTLLWSASGMTASIRTAFRIIWEADSGQTYIRSKLRDFSFVALAGVLLVGAFLLSVVAQVAVETGADLSDALGWSADAAPLTAVVEVATSALVVFAALLALYRFLPPASTRHHVWPSALGAAIASEIVVAGFAFYAARMADFNSVYGPLGAVFAFLLLVYLLATVVLLGAESVAFSSRGLETRDGSA